MIEMMYGKRIMFKEAVDAVDAKYGAPRTREKFAVFQKAFLNGHADVLTNPILFYRYVREEKKFMVNVAQAVSATPLCREDETLSSDLIKAARKKAYQNAWRIKTNKLFAIVSFLGIGICFGTIFLQESLFGTFNIIPVAIAVAGTLYASWSIWMRGERIAYDPAIIKVFDNSSR